MTPTTCSWSVVQPAVCRTPVIAGVADFGYTQSATAHLKSNGEV